MRQAIIIALMTPMIGALASCGGGGGSVSGGDGGGGGGVNPGGNAGAIEPLADKTEVDPDSTTTLPVFQRQEANGFTTVARPSAIDEVDSRLAMSSDGVVTIEHGDANMVFESADTVRRTVDGLETRTSGDGAQVVNFFNPRGETFDYTLFGAWADAQSAVSTTAFAAVNDFGAFVDGSRAPDDAQSSGSATYNVGLVEGFLTNGGEGVRRITGSAAASADFGAGTIQTTLTILEGASDVIRSGTLSFDESFGFSTSQAASENGYAGSLDGALYGPNGSEVGGGFDLANPQNNFRYVGSFAAKSDELASQGGGVDPGGTDEGEIADLADKPFLGKDYGPTPPVYALQDDGGFEASAQESLIGGDLTTVTLSDGATVTVSNDEYSATYVSSEIVSRTEAGLETRTLEGGGEVIRYFNPRGAALDYQTFGAWAQAEALVDDQGFTTATDIGLFHDGSRTPVAGLPTGSATYQGGLVEGFLTNGSNARRIAGSASAQADFDAGTVAAQLDLTTGVQDVISSGAMDLTTNLDFATQSASSNGGFQGSLNGALYGPNAEEIGGAFELTNPSSNERYVGSFAAGQ